MFAPIKIRAHHLLCMQGFRGYGYNDDFATHLKNIIERFRKNPDTFIQVISSCDEICYGCPHQIEDRCNKESDANYRIKIMDSKILKCIGIQPDSVDTIQAMTNQVNDTFKTQAQLAAICGDCQWTEKCIWFLSLKK
jgi:hypothetical protein